ncbi:hypothetical protein CXG81DRAFT_10685 [Caulochytrium protostelioides]|uniref:Exocyst complex component Sec3 PIP2-binding N-terminal domain-containing protein n=1 Tax=Caulochytrium protostelioides TaxID=1555241 RepID=A0A4P9XAW4_9FUNG|nr:hypothetical protein CXG81DRAFT_10685 [Caulochytrium protostelioides]|eukprot:RKP02523.1 hypothetical protein CXG81DRAFT_10685 [Caulochytrium protostelioides]
MGGSLRGPLSQLFVGTEGSSADKSSIQENLYVGLRARDLEGALWVLALTAKKNGKVRLHKVVENEGARFAIAKSWPLEEIRSLPKADRIKPSRVPFRSRSGQDAAAAAAAIDPASAALGGMATAALAQVTETDVASEEGDEAAMPDLTVDLAEYLNDFHWEECDNAADLEARLSAELLALEAANVHAIIGSEAPANAIIANAQTASAELSSVRNWLDHFLSQLSEMDADIHQIEVSNKTMQITMRNQRRLVETVERLLATYCVAPQVLETLQTAALDTLDGIAASEDALRHVLVVLQASQTEEFAGMQAVKDQKALYQGCANKYVVRLLDHLRAEATKACKSITADVVKRPPKTAFKLWPFLLVEMQLYPAHRLLRYCKDIDARRHLDMQIAFSQQIRGCYTLELQELVHVLRAMLPTSHDGAGGGGAGSGSGSGGAKGHRPYGREMSSSGAQTLGLTGPSMLAVGLTGPGPSGAHESGDAEMDKKPSRAALLGRTKRGGDDGVWDDDASQSAVATPTGELDGGRGVGSVGDAVDQALQQLLSAVSAAMTRHQNVLMDVFSLTASLSHASEAAPAPADDAAAAPVAKRDVLEWQSRLDQPREVIKDVKINKRIGDLMNTAFGDYAAELDRFADAICQVEPTFAVRCLVRLEKLLVQYEATCYSYLIVQLQGLHARFLELYGQYINGQVEAIGGVRAQMVSAVRSSKDKKMGVLACVRVFPWFVAAMERDLGDLPKSKTRSTVEFAYERLSKAIFDCLRGFQTLETFGQASGSRDGLNHPEHTGGSLFAGDHHAGMASASDEKETYNTHIFLVENMHHLYNELRLLKLPVLTPQIKYAKAQYDLHFEAYCSRVIRKPFIKLFEFFEGIQTLLKTHGPEEIAFYMQYNKSQLRDVLHKHTARDVRKGLETMYKKIQKHFTEEESLLQVLWHGVLEALLKQVQLFTSLIALCYPGSKIELEFTAQDILNFMSEGVDTS